MLRPQRGLLEPSYNGRSGRLGQFKLYGSPGLLLNDQRPGQYLIAVSDVESSQTDKVTIARDLVLFLHRPGGQRQFSATLAAQATITDSLAELLVWILENPQADLRIPVLAERAAMSPRNFARRFAQETGKTPARYVLNTRLGHACRYLESTKWPIERVAEKSGLRTADLMHRAFRQSLGLTPVEYRSRFAAR